jgi:hypothetical protein
MDGFNEQLREVEKDAKGTAQEFPDLTPEARQEVHERLDKTVKTLLKIQRDLKQVARGDGVDARTVQVVGLASGSQVTAHDFGRSFSSPPRGKTAFIPDGLALNTENNYMMDGTCKVLGSVQEWYIVFGHKEDARYALQLGEFHLQFVCDGVRQTRAVKFIKPAQTSTTRATFRKIGPLVERVRAIGEELKNMGAVQDGDGYKPDPNKFIDKSWFVTSLAGMKRAREAGQSIDRHAYGPLKGRKPVDTAKFQAQVKKLYDEECDCLITLREFQMNGMDFDF